MIIIFTDDSEDILASFHLYMISVNGDLFDPTPFAIQSRQDNIRMALRSFIILFFKLQGA